MWHLSTRGQIQEQRTATWPRACLPALACYNGSTRAQEEEEEEEDEDGDDNGHQLAHFVHIQVQHCLPAGIEMFACAETASLAHDNSG